MDGKHSLSGINIEYDLDEVKTRTGGATTNGRLKKKIKLMLKTRTRDQHLGRNPKEHGA